MPGWTTQAGIMTAGRNINILRYADDTTLMAESKEKLESLLMKVKEDGEKAGFKITVDGGCRHEIKRCLLLGRKVVTNLDTILKSRDITLPTKIHVVKTTVFPVVTYGCESWTVKKAEH